MNATPHARRLCIWLPNWPIQRLLAAPPPPSGDTLDEGLSEGPIVLWDEDPRRGRLVVAVCRRAAAAGVRTGQSVAQATDLLIQSHTGPPPQILRHDTAADDAAIETLACELTRHLCPRVGIETLDRFRWAGRPRHRREAIFAELAGVTHLFGNEHGVLAAAARILDTHRLAARMAIADTAGAAWALANFAPSRRPPTPTERPVAANPQFFLAPPGRTIAALTTLPTAGLRLRPPTVDLLARLGIETIGPLLRLPRAALATRLGTELCDRLAMATGELAEPIVPIELPAEASASLELQYPTAAADLLHHRIAGLIDQIVPDLRRRGRGVLRLACGIRFTDHPALTLEVGLFAPTLRREHLARLTIDAFEMRSAGEVTHLRIDVLQTAPLTARQRSLGDVPGGRELNLTAGSGGWTDDEDVVRLIDLLRGRLGESAVVGGRLTGDCLPELAAESVGMSASQIRRRGGPSRRPPQNRSPIDLPPGQIEGRPGDRTAPPTAPSVTDAARRPLRLLSQPIAIDPLAGEADPATDRLPARFRIAGRNRIVGRSWGPERIETRWWAGAMIRRDYFRLELRDETGSPWAWVYQDLRTGGWRLHGWFD